MILASLSSSDLAAYSGAVLAISILAGWISRHWGKLSSNRSSNKQLLLNLTYAVTGKPADAWGPREPGLIEQMTHLNEAVAGYVASQATVNPEVMKAAADAAERVMATAADKAAEKLRVAANEEASAKILAAAGVAEKVIAAATAAEKLLAAGADRATVMTTGGPNVETYLNAKVAASQATPI